MTAHTIDIDAAWEERILPALSEYTRIPCLSPAFDPDWEERGAIAAAAELLATDADFRSRLLAERARLFPMQVGRHGQLQEWFRDWDDPDRNLSGGVPVRALRGSAAGQCHGCAPEPLQQRRLRSREHHVREQRPHAARASTHLPVERGVAEHLSVGVRHHRRPGLHAACGGSSRMDDV